MLLKETVLCELTQRWPVERLQQTAARMELQRTAGLELRAVVGVEAVVVVVVAAA